jgi:hypothetical protein
MPRMCSDAVCDHTAYHTRTQTAHSLRCVTRSWDHRLQCIRISQRKCSETKRQQHMLAKQRVSNLVKNALPGSLRSR